MQVDLVWFSWLFADTRRLYVQAYSPCVDWYHTCVLCLSGYHYSRLCVVFKQRGRLIHSQPKISLTVKNAWNLKHEIWNRFCYTCFFRWKCCQWIWKLIPRLFVEKRKLSYIGRKPEWCGQSFWSIYVSRVVLKSEPSSYLSHLQYQFYLFGIILWTVTESCGLWTCSLFPFQLAFSFFSLSDHWSTSHIANRSTITNFDDSIYS